MTTIIYIATAIGLFIATQTNGEWEIVRHTLKEKALTSIAVSTGVIIAGTADGIWRSSDNGKSWHLASDGMMAAPWPGQMVERFVQIDNGLFAVLSNGELWFKHLDESLWHRTLSEIPQIKAIAAENNLSILSEMD